MKDILKTAGMLLALVVAGSAVAWWAVPAEAQPAFGGATKSFHGQVSCTTGGATISLSGATEITLHNTAPDVMYIYSNNGNPINQGIPICDAGTCVGTSLKLPSGSGVFRCAGAVGTVTAGVIGVN